MGKLERVDRTDGEVRYPAVSRRQLRLLRIEQLLGKNAVYAGLGALKKSK